MSVDAPLYDLVRKAVRDELAELLPKLTTRAPAPALPLVHLLSVDQVAKLCHVVRPTVRGWCLTGRMRARKAGTRWVVRREDLEAFLVEKKAIEVVTSAGQVDALVRKARRAGGTR